MAEYIEREALIREIKTAQETLQSDDDLLWELNKKYHSGLAWAHRIVLESPDADVAPVVHGRWEIEEVPNTVDTYGRPVKIARCSRCGFQWSNLHSVKKYFKGCPNCLAKMDAEVADNG